MAPLGIAQQTIFEIGTDSVLNASDLVLNDAKLTARGSLTIQGTTILLHSKTISGGNIEIRATGTVDLRGAQIEAKNSITISAQEILTNLSTCISAGGFVEFSTRIIETIKTT